MIRKDTSYHAVPLSSTALSFYIFKAFVIINVFY